MLAKKFLKGVFVINFADLQKVNDEIKTVEIHGKNYALVNERIIAFRKLYPQGFIRTKMIEKSDGECTFTAEVGYLDENWREACLGTGTANEKSDSSLINRTSFIENCETSAVGRALAMAGFGVTGGVASADEVRQAVAAQNNLGEKQNTVLATKNQIALLKKLYPDPAKALKQFNVTGFEYLTVQQASKLISDGKNK